MKAKKTISLILCLLMVLSVLTACGTEQTPEATNASTAQGEQQPTETPADQQFEHADLTMLIISPMPNEEAYNRIAEEMSKITEEKFNVTMHIMNVTISDYANKMNMILATGDPLDIFQGFIMYNQFVSMDYMLDMTPYMDLCQDALGVVGETAMQGFSDGKLYSLPIINLGATGGDAFAFRKDIIDALEIDLTQYKTLPELEEVLVKIKEAYPELTPMMSGGPNETIRTTGDMINGKYYDGLSNSFVSIDPEDPDAKVEVNVKRDYWKQTAELAWDWAQKGLVGYDEISIDYDNVKAGRAAVMQQLNGPAALMEAESVSGYEMVLWTPQIDTKPYITTNNAWSWSITEYTKHPEQAMLVLNELYINPELSNLLVWGVEGEHYQLVDKEKGLVNFLDGEHPGNAKYYNLIKDNIPNLYISYEAVYDVPNKYEAYQNWKTERMQVSPYLGFVPNEDAYANEATACKNILDQYTVALLSGQLDPSVAYDKMISELDAAGIETIREQIQLQLDEWVAKNSK